ncbi:MAG: hypothetical protein J0M29_05205 [Chitinophagales bacterium]|nr:hypothetical protein [Chitinophagales bacterium]
MNNTFGIKALALLLMVVPTLTSCDKCKKDDEPTLKDEMVGEWKIKSMTFDGSEAMGFVVTSSKMEFEEYSGTNGDFEWGIFYVDGSSENQEGDYEVDEEDKELELENNEGERIKFDIDVDGDDLELSGIVDGERVVIKAERD